MKKLNITGYDQNRFDKSIKDFLCPICTEVARSPQDCSECSTIFCQQCLNEWKQKNQTCPNCRSQIQNINPIGKTLLRIYNNMEIKCINYTICNTIMCLGDIQSHEDKCLKNTDKINQKKFKQVEQEVKNIYTSIEQLKQLGFAFNYVIDALQVCEKNKGYTSKYLFDSVYGIQQIQLPIQFQDIQKLQNAKLVQNAEDDKFLAQKKDELIKNGTFELSTDKKKLTVSRNLIIQDMLLVWLSIKGSFVCKYRWNKIGDTGLIQISEYLPQFKNLISLRLILNDNYIGEDGTKSLSQNLTQLKNLKTLGLYLGDNKIGDNGCIYLNQCLLQLQNIQNLQLYLICNHIGEIGSRAISQSINQMKNLQNMELNLWYIQIKFQMYL